MFESAFGPADYLSRRPSSTGRTRRGVDGGTADLQLYTNARRVERVHRAPDGSERREWAFFTAFSPDARLALGYVWRRADFPWLGIWEENRSRPQPPWNGSALTRGMEFGVSPFPESRREMIERGRLFDVRRSGGFPPRRA